LLRSAATKPDAACIPADVSGVRISDNRLVVNCRALLSYPAKRSAQEIEKAAHIYSVVVELRGKADNQPYDS